MHLKILIIIPCFNEQAALPQLLSDLFAINSDETIMGYRSQTGMNKPTHDSFIATEKTNCFNEKYRLDIVVINDCSTDKTAEIAKRNKIKLINLPVNLGIGGAVQSGLKYALQHNYDIAVQMDGDGQHPPIELIKLINCHKNTGANLVIGSRFIEKEGFQSTFMRRMGVAYFHWLNKFFTGKSIYDSTSGFRLFDKKAIQSGADYYPDDYPEPESLVVFAKAGLSIKETPVIMLQRNGGKSSIGNFTSLYYCLKVTLAMFFSYIRKQQ